MRSLEWQMQCYGCSEESLRKQVEGSLSVKIEGAGGYGMVAMSLLSDAQEVLEHGDPEKARQYINCAKWVISNYWMQGDKKKPDDTAFQALLNKKMPDPFDKGEK